MRTCVKRVCEKTKRSYSITHLLTYSRTNTELSKKKQVIKTCRIKLVYVDNSVVDSFPQLLACLKIRDTFRIH